MCVSFAPTYPVPVIFTSPQGVKDAPAPRPNKRPRLGPSPSEAEVDVKSPVKGQTSKSSADKKTARSELQDEFMQVMKPRTKKGPSWKDDDPVPGPSTDPPAAATKKAKKSKKVSQEQEAEANESTHEQEASVEAISDIDWLKKHTKSTLDTSEVEKAYEQSEDESIDDLDANEDPNVGGDPSLLSRVLTSLRSRNPSRTRLRRLFCRLRGFSYATWPSPVPKRSC